MAEYLRPETLKSALDALEAMPWSVLAGGTYFYLAMKHIFSEVPINAGEFRGGFGINYTVRLRRGTARASLVMDHGRFGPNGMAGGAPGGVNRVRVEREDGIYNPPHLSKDQDIELAAGGCVHISTPAESSQIN